MIERAYIDGARGGAGLDRLNAEIARIMGVFAATGAERVEPAALQPAGVMLDLYGEDIRARAYVTHDTSGELMLRPDFTVPVVERHMATGAEPARYCYAGPVWRRRAAEARAREYVQCGLEVFGDGDAAACDAGVFAAVREALAGAPLTVATGDMGLLLAAIDALETTPARKAALRRHLWRPGRFHRLLARYSGPAVARSLPGPAEAAAAMAAAGPEIGLRSGEEVAARIARLAEDAATPPLAAAEVALIEGILGLKCSCVTALARLRDMAADAPALASAVDRFAARLDALAALGIDTAALPFEGEYGRTALEYYDGFVFGFFAPGRTDLPVIASGGRYDALTAALGQGRAIPAVGGIVRPEALLALAS